MEHDQRQDPAGTELREPRLYARFSRRLGAAVTGSLVQAAGLLAFMGTAEVLGADRGAKAPFLGWVAFLLLYEPVLVSWRGATLGHALANVRVVCTRTRMAPGFFRATARFWLKAFLGWFSFAFMGTTRRYQALHDLVVGTTVEIHDRARALPGHYALERPAEAPPLPSGWRRVAIIMLYSALTIVANALILMVTQSEACLDGLRCSPMERSVERILDWAALGALAAWIIFGWQGRLPGARRYALRRDAEARLVSNREDG